MDKEHQHKNEWGKTILQCIVMIVLAVLLMWMMIGCSEVEDEAHISPVHTILFYMGGDNNLSGEVQQKTAILKDVSVPPCGRLLVYMDCKDNNPQLWEAGNGKLTLLRNYEESNSADATIFRNVLREVVEQYPAPSYGLVLFSHASGWMPESTYSNPALRSVVIDGSDEMEIADLAEAIPDGMFDYILFEACYMAGVEVAYELKDKTTYIVASSAEIVSPGFSSIYKESLPLLFKKDADLINFCQAVEADYKTRNRDYASLTLSLIDTRKLDDIATVLHAANVPPTTIDTQSFSRYGGTLYFDLCDSYKHLSAEIRTDLQAAVDACVIWKSATSQFMPNYGGFEIRAHSGLTTYIQQDHYRNLNEAYRQTKWYKAITNQIWRNKD